MTKSSQMVNSCIQLPWKNKNHNGRGGREICKEERLKLETRVFASPHLHIVAYFCFSCLSFLYPSSPVCREDCEEQNPVEKLWLRPNASHRGKRIKSVSQFCWRHSSTLLMPTLTTTHNQFAVISTELKAILQFCVNLICAANAHQELESSRVAIITVGEDTCKNRFNPVNIVVYQYGTRIPAALRYMRDIHECSMLASYHLFT